MKTFFAAFSIILLLSSCVIAATISETPLAPSPLQSTDKIPLGRAGSSAAYTGNLGQVTTYVQTHTTPGQIGAEPALGAPGTSGYCLKSASDGTRSWGTCITGVTAAQIGLGAVPNLNTTPAVTLAARVFGNQTSHFNAKRNFYVGNIIASGHFSDVSTKAECTACHISATPEEPWYVDMFSTFGRVIRLKVDAVGVNPDDGSLIATDKTLTNYEPKISHPTVDGYCLKGNQTGSWYWGPCGTGEGGGIDILGTSTPTTFASASILCSTGTYLRVCNSSDLTGLGVALSSSVPTALASLTADSTHRLVTDTEKSTWDSKAPGSHTHSWSAIASGTPTTISGYGITDAYTKTQADARYPVFHTYTSGAYQIAPGNIYVGTVDPGSIPATDLWIDTSGEVGGISPSAITCSGTDKLSAYNASTGAFTCSADQTGAGGTGITSLGGLTAPTQTFANDTNVTISSDTSTHTLGWTGTLSKARGGAGGDMSAVTFPSSGTIATTGGNVATATALAANGANCSAGSYPLGVDASGAAESCTALPTFPSGVLVGTTDSQTLSSKTLTNPTINGGVYGQTTSTTIDTSAVAGATISSSGATSLTITNVVSGRYFDFKVSSSGGGALSVSTLTPTWVTGTPASITAGKSSWFVCKGTGANTADCAAVKENY